MDKGLFVAAEYISPVDLPSVGSSKSSVAPATSYARQRLVHGVCRRVGSRILIFGLFELAVIYYRADSDSGEAWSGNSALNDVWLSPYDLRGLWLSGISIWAKAKDATSPRTSSAHHYPFLAVHNV